MGSYGCQVTSPRFQLSPAPLRHLYEAENDFFLVGFGKMGLQFAVAGFSISGAEQWCAICSL